jgi:hypothetical protein
VDSFGVEIRVAISWTTLAATETFSVDWIWIAVASGESLGRKSLIIIVIDELISDVLSISVSCTEIFIFVDVLVVM